MMSKIFELEGPVNGEYSTEIMLGNFSECELASVRFYNADGAMVTPSAGTVKFEGSPDGETWRDFENGSFDATAVYSQSRLCPYGLGLVLVARITLAGIVGASSFKATVWRD